MIPAYLVLAGLLACMGAFWVEVLYRQNADILSFPKEVEAQNRYRWLRLMAALAIFFPFWEMASSLPLLLSDMALVCFLLLVICTDFEQQVIFDRMLAPFGFLAFARIFLLRLPPSDYLVAAAAGGAFFFFLAWVSKGGIGGGDIKLMFVLGLWFGTIHLFRILCAGMILGGLAAACLLLFGGKGRKDRFAYGPYFAIAAMADAFLW